MSDRLKSARVSAGFATATAAIEHHHWKASNYRDHESGKNSFNQKEAEVYARAYNVSAQWLLSGDKAISMEPK